MQIFEVPKDLSTELFRWLLEEEANLPKKENKHLLHGLNGEHYLFDAAASAAVEISGPVVPLLHLLLETSLDQASALVEALGEYEEVALQRAMLQCSAALRFFERQAFLPPIPTLSRPGFNLSLNAGMACNLSCRYCDPLNYRSATRGQVISEETTQQALDFFYLQVPPDEVGCVTYSVGGEPLLYRKLLDRVAGYTRDLREQGVQATQYLITNGLLITDGVIEYLKVNDIAFGMSLDGPPEINDVQRTTSNGSGSYAPAVRAAEAVLAQRPHTSVSAVLTALAPRPLPIYQHLLGLGFQRIIVKPVRGRPDTDYAFTPENLPALLEGYREYARFFVEALLEGRREIYATINPYDYFARFVLRVFRGEKHTYRCGAASMANLTVAPDGTLYPCEGFIGQEKYRLGHVSTGFDEPAVEQFSRLYVDDKPGCQDCWARYQCGGGCYLLGALINDDIATPDPAECELTRFLVELAIWVLHTVDTQRPEALVELQEWCDQQGWFGTETVSTPARERKQPPLELPVLP